MTKMATLFRKEEPGGGGIAGDGGGLQGVGDVRLVELVRVLAVPGAFNYRPLSGGLLTREVEPEPPESRLKVLMHGSPYTETSFLIMSPIRFKSHLKFSLFSFIRMDKVVLVYVASVWGRTIEQNDRNPPKIG